MLTYSEEHIKYLKNIKKKKRLVCFTQIIIIILFLVMWELLSRFQIINSFLFSSPSNIIKTIKTLIISNNFFHHAITTIYEIFLSTFISFLLGFLIATILWSNEFLRKVFDPYLTILNSLPKVSLGPLIIIWVGASINSIIFMSLMISLFITIINLYTFFNNTPNNYITLLKSMNASKVTIYKKVIIPSNLKNIISTLKINISMNLIGLLPPVGEKIFFNKCYSRY